MALTSDAVRFPVLQAICCVAEGAAVGLSQSAVAAALRNVFFCVLGGRAGLPRSLGSVHAGAVVLFLGGSFRGVRRRGVKMPLVKTAYGMAVSRDGTTLFIGDTLSCPVYGAYSALPTPSREETSRLYVVDVASGTSRFVGGWGTQPLQFRLPGQIWVAADDFVFVAEFQGRRVQALTPQLEFHRYYGADVLECVKGVCANEHIVVVVDMSTLCVFDRKDALLLRRFARKGGHDGELSHPGSVCFLAGDQCVAVADNANHRVSVFETTGAFVRQIGVGFLHEPASVACSAWDELVVAHDPGVCVFGSAGELRWALKRYCASSVALHHTKIYVASSVDNEECFVFD